MYLSLQFKNNKETFYEIEKNYPKSNIITRLKNNKNKCNIQKLKDFWGVNKSRLMPLTIKNKLTS